MPGFIRKFDYIKVCVVAVVLAFGLIFAKSGLIWLLYMVGVDGSSPMSAIFQLALAISLWIEGTVFYFIWRSADNNGAIEGLMVGVIFWIVTFLSEYPLAGSLSFSTSEIVPSSILIALSVGIGAYYYYKHRP